MLAAGEPPLAQSLREQRDGAERPLPGHAPGLLVLVGVHRDDTEQDAEHLAEKTVRLRIFEDEAGRMNRSLLEVIEAGEEGGVLVYAVCSLTQAEGEEQIARFVEAHPEFSAERFEAPLPVWSTGHGAYVRPTEGLDGFYYARLRKAYG